MSDLVVGALSDDMGGGTFQADPKWTHDCAKEIMKVLGLEYDVWKMYDIVGVLNKYKV